MVFDYGTRGVCNQLHQKGCLLMGGACDILAPMVTLAQKVVESLTEQVDPFCKAEFLGKVNCLLVSVFRLPELTILFVAFCN